MKKLLIILLLSVSSWGAVAKDASMTAGNSADGLNQQASSATTISSTGITVGAGATCLVGIIALEGVSTAPTGITMTWNSVSMTQHAIATHTKVVTAFFVLVSPASGAKTLQASWTNSSDVYMSAISFTGTDTSTCVNATDDITATAGTSITITSTTNGATVGQFATDGATPTMNFTKIYAESPLLHGGGANFTLGGTSNVHTFTGAGGTTPALSGVHVIAGAGPTIRTMPPVVY